MSNDRAKTKSRLRTPWDYLNDEEINPLQRFLREKYRDHYLLHHVILAESDEANFLNQFSVTNCHLCGSKEIIHYGKANGLNRYYCKECKHTFVITTNTIFDSHKLAIEEWIEFCVALFGFGSSNLISKVNKNSITTSIYWLNKLFLLLHDYGDDIVCSGIVETDEIYYKERADKLELKPDGTEYAGLSRNQICIFTACDNAGHIYAKANGKGKPSQKRCWDALGTHIAHDSTLIHDMERAHKILVRKLDLHSQTYNQCY